MFLKLHHIIAKGGCDYCMIVHVRMKSLNRQPYGAILIFSEVKSKHTRYYVILIIQTPNNAFPDNPGSEHSQDSTYLGGLKIFGPGISLVFICYKML